MMLTSQYSSGRWIDGRTPAFAARWTIESIPSGRSPSPVGVTNIGLYELERSVVAGGGDVGFLYGTPVEVVEIVQPDHELATGEECVAKVRPDEACGSRLRGRPC